MHSLSGQTGPEGNEHRYSASIVGADVKNVAKSANIKANPQGYYSKIIKNRTTSTMTETTGGGVFVECITDFE